MFVGMMNLRNTELLNYVCNDGTCDLSLLVVVLGNASLANTTVSFITASCLASAWLGP